MFPAEQVSHRRKMLEDNTQFILFTIRNMEINCIPIGASQEAIKSLGSYFPAE